ncbi:hypothetical protein QJS83_02010 [Bdellovibrio sp. 22V]|uniref:COG4315 family predicted lipoprotein n=1 Tax=Bdellovibrio sp. 22V TaxID=3044166 RepID=UPI002543C112|nr:hypothetical protein [Bdellovibrio sp. 22V]WII72644.1 hypothetical protein QJS83_02010 [Bdellovibrio sp. 22V]
MKILKLIVIQLTLSLFALGVFANGTTPRVPLTTAVTNAEGEMLLADSIGKTLYVFDPDLNQPMPTCKETCAEIWPPYLLTAEEVATLTAPLGMVRRHNNQMQLTYNGRPVYTYAFDRVKGDDLGDGIGGVWHYVELESK